MQKHINIAIVGPESSGKSFLAQKLGEFLSADIVYEFARQYLNEHGHQYTLNDVVSIGERQWNLEQNALRQSEKRYRIFDTNLDIIRIWQEVVFNTCDLSTLKKISYHHYDAYLLCYPDLAWEADPQRELPNEKDRINIYNMYHEIVVDSERPFHIVRGQGLERVQSTIEFIKQIAQ